MHGNTKMKFSYSSWRLSCCMEDLYGITETLIWTSRKSLNSDESLCLDCFPIIQFLIIELWTLILRTADSQLHNSVVTTIDTVHTQKFIFDTQNFGISETCKTIIGQVHHSESCRFLWRMIQKPVTIPAFTRRRKQSQRSKCCVTHITQKFLGKCITTNVGVD